MATKLIFVDTSVSACFEKMQWPCTGELVTSLIKHWFPLGKSWPGCSSSLCICQCAMTRNELLLKKIRLADLIGNDCCQLLTHLQLILPNSTHFTSAPPLRLCCISTSGHEITKYLFVTAKWACPVSSHCGLVQQHGPNTPLFTNKQAPFGQLAPDKWLFVQTINTEDNDNGFNRPFLWEVWKVASMKTLHTDFCGDSQIKGHSGKRCWYWIFEISFFTAVSTNNKIHLPPL